MEIEFKSDVDGSVESSVDFEMHDRLGGLFCWTGGCCVVTEGARLWYGCEGCGCGGCQAQATYTYECDENDPLPIRWFALVGRGAAGTAAATNGTFSIPAGRTCFVGAFVASTEHPTWTGRMVAGTDSKYDDDLRPTALMLGVFPLSLVQSNYPVATNGVDGVHPTTVVRNGQTNEVVVVTNRTRSAGIRVVTNDFASATDFGIYTNRLVRRGEIAYLTGEPSAPQLTAKLRGLPDWVPVKWSGTLRSERTERRNLDDRDYAATNTAGAAGLDVAAWMHELVGGKFTMTVQATNAPAATTTFSIRGKNPRDGAALDCLVSDVDEEFRSFAWRIAMHETKRWSRRGTYLFNQFNPISGRQGSLKELPNRGAPDGWGIGQIDRSGNQPGSRDVFTREVYNWKTNIVAMNIVLRAKKRIYERQIDHYRDAYGNLPTWCEPNVTTNLGGRIVTAREWGIITYYNGAGGCTNDTVGGQSFLTPIVFHPSTGEWSLHENANRYVSLVMTNRVQTTVEY